MSRKLEKNCCEVGYSSKSLEKRGFMNSDGDARGVVRDRRGKGIAF